MAEIQRSRSTGAPGERPNMNAYNVLMLLFTVAAVLVAVLGALAAYEGSRLRGGLGAR
jgi:hypothetical protein